jgi:Ca-activated chloride channel homolog
MRFPRIARYLMVLTGLFAGFGAASDVSITSTGVVISITPKKDGQALPAAKDLAVRDDKHPVPVNQLRPLKDEPLVFSVLVDGSGSMYDLVKEENAAALGIFRALSKRGNQGYLCQFQSPTTFPPAIDLDIPTEVLDASAAERMLDENRRGPTVLYDAIGEAVKQQLASGRNNQTLRRAIIVLSDGADNSSDSTFDEALVELQRAGISLFAVHFPSSDRNGKRGAKEGLEHLRKLSRESGGAIVEMDARRDFVSELIVSVDNQYLLSVTLPPGVAHSLHTLEVRCKSGNFAVSAPALYVPQ